MKVEPTIKYGCAARQGMTGEAYTLLTPGAFIQPTDDGRILWHILNYTPDEDENKTYNAFAQAIAIWQPAFPTTITLDSTSDAAEAHIKLYFVSENHPEYSDVFDGEDGTLALGFAPVDDEPLKGYILMDDGENWGDMHTPNTKDLLTVFLHELGHTFNLGHESRVRDAIMYPSYSGEKREIHPDDIEGIQSIYGRFGPPRPGTPQPNSGCLSFLVPFLAMFGQYPS